MKDMRTREKVIAATIPALALLLAGATMGLLWPVMGGFTLFLLLVPAVAFVFAHGLYRQVLRPRRIRRFLRRRGVPADSLWKMSLRFERGTGRDFTTWHNPLLALFLHEYYSGYTWTADAYQAWRGYDLGADWDVFFSKVWRHLPSPSFDDRKKMVMATPLVALIAEGKVDVVEASRLAQSDMSFEALMMVVRDGLPLEYAAAL